MFCPSCGVAVKIGQRFCTSCGIALVDTAVHQTTEAVPTTTPFAGAPLPPPTTPPAVAAGAATVPVTAVADALHQETTALTVIEQTAHSPAHDVWAAAATAAVPVQTEQQLDHDGPHTDSIPFVVEGTQPFRITPLVTVGALAGVLAVASAFVDVATVEISGDSTSSFSWKLNDFASNYTVGAIIAALLLIGGAALGATGRRVGTGLAGGAGLALAGMMGFVLGQVTGLFDATEVGLLQGGGSFSLTTTQEVGYWLAAIAAALGVVAFVLSLAGRIPDGRPPANSVIGVAGAVATLLVVVGTLIPGSGADFADQFSNELIPPITLMLRLLVLVLIAVGGVTGFISGRRWGLGLALGSISIGVWQWLTALTESGDIPAGIAGGNWMADTVTPHIVTTVGVVAMVLAAVAGLLIKPQPQ